MGHMRVAKATLGLSAILLAAGCYTGSEVSASGLDGSGTATDGPGGSESGDDAGEDPPIPDADAAEVGVSGLRRLSIREYERTIADLTGLEPEAVGEILPIDNLTPFDNDYTTQTPSEPLVKGLELLAGDIANAVIADAGLRDALVPCTPAGADDAVCFQAFLSEFGRRALRRPLTDEEVQRYSVLIEHGVDADDFDAAVAAGLRMFLQHPELIYRVEIGEPVEGQPGVFRLGAYEVATRLSYFLSGTTPEPWLLDAAEAGELDTKEGIAAAAAQLLEGDAGRTSIGRFHGLWLGYEKLADEGLSGDMLLETQSLIERNIFDERQPWSELLTATETYVTAELAEHYGIPEPDGGEGWVSYEESGRGGLFSHASFLSVGVKFGDTSPTQRGLLVRTRLFCQEIPLPSDDLMVDVDEPPGADPDACKSERYYMTNEPACATCHQLMDPIGFGLEQYDASGAFRTEEPDKPECQISGDGDFAGVGTFNGPKQLGEMAAESGLVEACASRMLYRYATGHFELDEHDEALIERVLEDQGGTFELFGFVETYVSSEAFRHRRELQGDGE
jgi:hypothetical protein